ncbi:MAG: hypothetical protein EBY37_05580, partial [Flavobacteriia bacterium]|nr:hypothetical protein [Flavobacteriia bacterium]
ISPTLFLDQEQLILALGAAGGSRIVPAVTQVAHRYLAQKKSLQESLHLPRVYPYQDSLWLENHPEVKDLNADFNPALVLVKMIDEKARFGRVHAIAYDIVNQIWTGAADPDWEGTVENYPAK